VKVSFHKKFFKILFTIILPIIIVIVIFSMYLFDRLIENKKTVLVEKSATIASLISNIASFDRMYLKVEKFNNLSSTATIYQVQKTFQSLDDMGLQLEYLVGEISNNSIEFIAYSKQKPAAVKLNKHLDIPMKKALLGEKGVGIGVDYKNEKVFATYQPIKGTKWGLVIKQPYSTYSKTIRKTAWMVSTALLILIMFLYIFLKNNDEKNRKKVEYSEHRFQQLVESSNNLIWEVDTNGVYSYVSERINDILGYTSEEVLKKTPFDFMSSEEEKNLKIIYINIILSESNIVELENIRVHKDGYEVCFVSNGSPFYNEEGELQGYRGVDRNVTLLKQKQKEIENLAYYDNLTGLANRQNISEKITQELNYTKRNNLKSALLFLDLDDFKQINDTYGHEHGDEVLRVVAKEILNSIRNFDTAGRLGGDEFIILVHGIKENDKKYLEHLDIIIQRIIEAINKPISYKGELHNVGVSIGVSILPDDGDNCQDIVKHADSAMYEAKDLGKNRVVFYKKVI
jgi:diguanylate cyclase (GGDEF)-like protein/PAS domain S-box-containing protein